MGYSRCGVPGCPTRPGQGKLFRKFPRDENLASRWVQSLPKNFVLKKSSAICENHFNENQFEKPRQDGKKRLRDSAVPNSSMVPSAAQSSSVQPTPVPSPALPLVDRSNNSNEGDAVQALIMLHNADCKVDAKCHDISFDADNEACNSTVLEHEDSRPDLWSNDEDDKSRSVVHCTESEFILDETTGDFIPILSSASDAAYTVQPQNQVYFAPSWSHCGSLVLDEVTGEFYSNVSDHENDNVAELVPEASVETLNFIVNSQNEEIERLKQLTQEQNNIIQKYRDDADFNGTVNCNFLRKYDSMRKCRERLTLKNKDLEARLKREFYSPWLTDSQVRRLQLKSRRGVVYTTEEIRKGLIWKMRCGTSAYGDLAKEIPFLPSVSCLQKRVQFIQFDNGVLHEVFDLLKSMAYGMKDIEKDCQVVIDEMAIQEGERYCNSLKKWVGSCTMPSHSGVASKALVIILAGIAVRWKIAVAIHFTNKKGDEYKEVKINVTGKAYAEILDEVITKAENIGLYVSGITGDMGADNLAFWREKGITGGRKENIVCSYPNPVRTDERIYVTPDAVHVMKAAKNMMESNRSILLPSEIVIEEGLPTAEVNYKHIEDLMEFENGHELKVAFRLKEHNVHCNKQFKKMKVGTTKAVLCHRTGVGLQLLAEVKEEPSYTTTAWFVLLLNTFFTLVTGRKGSIGFSKQNQTAYEKAINLFKKIDYLFQNMKVGNSYKPCQRGVRILCASLLGMAEYLMERRNYHFVLLGRFTSDCIENLFSCIRLSQSVPHAVAFLQILKVITLAQFSQAVVGSSYDYDESSKCCIDFLEEAKQKAQERATKKIANTFDELCRNSIRKLEEADFCSIDQWEKNVVYDMAGSVIAAVKSSGMVTCDACIDATKWKEEVPHPSSVITLMKEFTALRGDDGEKTLQVCVSDHVFKAILSSEISFRLYRQATFNFDYTDVKKYFVDNLMYVWNETPIPQCHDLPRKILNVFIDARLKEYGKNIREQLREEALKAKRVTKSSKSIAMHAAGDLISVTNRN